jgi:hypothetical protein
LVLFVQAHGRKIRELGFEIKNEGYLAPDLTRFAEHISEGGGIVDMAYQQEPDSILWCVRADGVLLGLTYNREEEVYGWHRHVTDGYFESVCVIPDAENNRDQLWSVVKRTIGGAAKRFVEVCWCCQVWPGLFAAGCRFISEPAGAAGHILAADEQ